LGNNQESGIGKRLWLGYHFLSLTTQEIICIAYGSLITRLTNDVVAFDRASESHITDRILFQITGFLLSAMISTNKIQQFSI